MPTGEHGHTCVFGLSWGDEGKGKVVDMLCPAFDLVVRFNGGANAGHTVCVGDEKFALHLLPSGVLHKGATSVIGPGVVVDPIGLVSEIKAIAARGIDLTGRLQLSDRAHLVLPWHKIEDRAREADAGDAGRIGTTARGIGPCYADKMYRSSALRVADWMSDPDWSRWIESTWKDKQAYFLGRFGNDGGYDLAESLDELRTARDVLRPYVVDTTQLLHESIERGKTVLFEGANGMLLDVDHGTYPFVTSSSTGPHGIGAGAGVPPSLVAHRVAVVKAYATRVGSGPFVSELKDETGDRIRVQGNEFGTTTGRPRRCGWFDAVSARYGARISGATNLALMHLDTLSGFEQVGVCVAYEVDGQRVSYPPARADVLERAHPVFEYMPGWSENIRGVRRFDDLPMTTRRYIERLEQLVGAPVTLAGIGPERSQTLLRGWVRGCVEPTEPTPA